MNYDETFSRAITVTWTEAEASRFLLAFDHLMVQEDEKADREILTDFYNNLSEILGEE